MPYFSLRVFAVPWPKNVSLLRCIFRFILFCRTGVPALARDLTWSTLFACCNNRLRNLRSIDRRINESRYPALFFPQLYLLDVGYRGFFQSFPELCEPRGYVPMNDPRYSTERKDSGMRNRRSWKRNKSFSNLRGLVRCESNSF